MTAASPPPPAPAPAPHQPKAEPNEITIVSHSNLFYWWPVWAVGFLAAAITGFEQYHLAVVPAGSEIVPETKEVVIKTEKTENGTTKESTETIRDAPIMKIPPKSKLVVDPATNVPEQPKLLVTQYRAMGVVFVFVLILVIIITNVPLRGMWSVMIILTLVLLTIIFILLHWWEYILNALYFLDIRINLGGYIVISTALAVIWALTVFFFDRQRYITFTPGQLKVCEQIGGGEQVYDAVGISLQKQRSDLFRHYILGLGSGDLIVKTSGAQSHQFDLPNVLFINHRVRRIEELLKKKAVVEA